MTDDTTSAALPSAFDLLPELAEAPRVSLFLDYDGTLTPIVARPELAVLPPEARRALDRVARIAHVTVVTGRDLDDALAMLGAGLTVAGSHGFEVGRPDGRREVFGDGMAFLPSLQAAAEEAATRLPSLAGVRLERKRFAFALHYREAPEHAAAVAALAGEVVQRHPDLRLGLGKMVVEVRPGADWDKGRVVLALLERQDAAGLMGQGAGDRAVPVYLGDDVTDEDAFTALLRREPPGRGVIVGERAAGRTAARFALRDVPHVIEWLDSLADHRSRSVRRRR